MLVALSVLAATACSQAKFAAVNLPTRLAGGYSVHTVAYGDMAAQRLDIYTPKGRSEPTDVVVFFYGGRWTFGAKENYRFVGAALAKQGFVTVIPDYRKYPAVRFPLFVEDGAKAVAWTHDHITAYRGNPARLHLLGHSAGAHIVALLAADESYLKREGKNARRVIHDVAGLAGPYDFTPEEKDLVDIFGPPARFPLMRVPTFIEGHEPPMLLLHGDRDTSVAAYNHERLAASIHGKGGAVQVKTYPGADHISILSAFSWLPAKAAIVNDVAAFFRGQRAPS